MIMGEQTWFPPCEDSTVVPCLVEMLAAVLEDNLTSEEVAAEIEAKPSDGLILLGYIAKKSWEVSGHSLPGPPNEFVRRRLKQVFGDGKCGGT